MKLIIIGGGGHGKVVRDLAFDQKKYDSIAIADDRFSSTFLQDGLLYVPLESAVERLQEDPAMEAVIAIGNNQTRRSVVERLGLPDSRYAVLVHPSATIGSEVTIGWGSVVLPGAIVSCGAALGNHCIVNSGAIVEHDSVIESFVHLSPASSLAGNVVVEEGVHIGIGASIIQGIKVGRWSTLGAGAVAVREIPCHCTAIGVPAKPMRYHHNPENGSGGYL